MSKRNIILLILAAMSAVLLSACQTSVGPTTRVNDSYIHIRASWSPDGKSIAFSSTVQGSEGIYIVDSTGGNMRQVFKGVGVGAAWSPDGAWIVFSQSNSLYKMKPSGDSLTQITAAIGAIRPSWSKDGTKIAFIEADVNGTLGTFLLDVRTDSISQLALYGDCPSWHPSTGELVVLSGLFDPYSGVNSYQFVAINITTFAARPIASFYSGASCGFASISPTGLDFVYGLVPQVDYAQVWRYNIALNQHVQLTDDGGDYPAWSPDGTKIVYTRTQNGDGGLWVMNADGSNKRRLTKP